MEGYRSGKREGTAKAGVVRLGEASASATAAFRLASPPARFLSLSSSARLLLEVT